MCRSLSSVAELKKEYFLNEIFLFKSATILLPTRNVLITIKSFQIKHFMMFYLKGHWK